MTSLARVILDPFGPERTSRAGSAKGKNLSSSRAMTHKSQTDPLLNAEWGSGAGSLKDLAGRLNRPVDPGRLHNMTCPRLAPG